MGKSNGHVLKVKMLAWRRYALCACFYFDQRASQKVNAALHTYCLDKKLRMRTGASIY